MMKLEIELSNDEWAVMMMALSDHRREMAKWVSLACDQGDVQRAESFGEQITIASHLEERLRAV